LPAEFAARLPYSGSDTQPDYLDLLASGELERRVERLHALLAACTVCPRDCGNDAFRGGAVSLRDTGRLAEMLLELQERGCHNIGFVSPTHYAPQMARAVLLAAQRSPAP
jgi:uncharacterized Fe-S radical SAM superfamily protein PflX